MVESDGLRAKSTGRENEEREERYEEEEKEKEEDKGARGLFNS